MPARALLTDRLDVVAHTNAGVMARAATMAARNIWRPVLLCFMSFPLNVMNWKHP